MILLIDNYDSFAFNLYQLVGSVNPDIRVIRSDEMTVPEIEALAPSHIILSPGPGRPCDAGVYEDVIRELKGKIPIFGVCLGHQAIGEVFGGTVGYAGEIMHGKEDTIRRTGPSRLLDGMADAFGGARYHSLVIDRATVPDELIVTAETADGEIMAVEHRDYPVFGVQFHPESILTTDGVKIIENFLAQ